MAILVDRACRACGDPFKCTKTQIKNAQGIYCSHRCRNVGRTKPPKERFWKHVRKSAGCWLWTGSTNEHGYGQLAINGKPYKAHRFSYELHYGSFPPNKPFALHSCDTPLCVRPDHLFAGTQAVNMADMATKQRQSRARHWRKLTESQVLEIREASESTTQTQLGAKYGVSQSAIYYILSRRTWKHI